MKAREFDHAYVFHIQLCNSAGGSLGQVHSSTNSITSSREIQVGAMECKHINDPFRLFLSATLSATARKKCIAEHLLEIATFSRICNFCNVQIVLLSTSVAMWSLYNTPTQWIQVLLVSQQ